VVAAALGIPEQPGVPAGEALARVLARQQLLLVLDNCEHVIGAAAQLCAGLLAAADDVRVLATSREPLAVAGEARVCQAPAAQRPGTGTDRPGRPGPHQRADRRAAAHQHPPVGSHLDRIRGKTGCRRRADLTRLALSAGLV
jgi:predicted ATPase